MASAANSPVGPNLPPSAQKRQMPIFPAVQKLGCEVLGHLVSKVETSEDPGKIVWTLGNFCFRYQIFYLYYELSDDH